MTTATALRTARRTRAHRYLATTTVLFALVIALFIAALAVGAGVGAGCHAEEFGLQQRVGHGGDVDADERAAGAAGGGVDGVRQQFLAGAGFAQQQHRAGGLCCAARLALDFSGGRTGADKAGKGVPRAARAIAHAHTGALLAATTGIVEPVPSCGDRSASKRDVTLDMEGTRKTSL